MGDRAYDELRKWGRFEIVDNPQNADMVLLLSVTSYDGGYVVNGTSQTVGANDGTTNSQTYSQGEVKHAEIPGAHGGYFFLAAFSCSLIRFRSSLTSSRVALLYIPARLTSLQSRVPVFASLGAPGGLKPQHISSAPKELPQAIKSGESPWIRSALL
jgi:hypothetical protein